MANRRRRKFHRSGEASKAGPSALGIFISDECKLKIIAGAVCALMLVFIKGLIIGRYFGSLERR